MGIKTKEKTHACLTQTGMSFSLILIGEAYTVWGPKAQACVCSIGGSLQEEQEMHKPMTWLAFSMRVRALYLRYRIVWPSHGQGPEQTLRPPCFMLRNKVSSVGRRVKIITKAYQFSIITLISNIRLGQQCPNESP